MWQEILAHAYRRVAKSNDSSRYVCSRFFVTKHIIHDIIIYSKGIRDYITMCDHGSWHFFWIISFGRQNNSYSVMRRKIRETRHVSKLQLPISQRSHLLKMLAIHFNRIQVYNGKSTKSIVSIILIRQFTIINFFFIMYTCMPFTSIDEH